ncbi:hypothetical protein VTK73DRAFT_1043 [Phialemonium thermophilum]|uniref:DUF2415 domain-containing protein n=1 Tax=Phialemonium thermophilum TaxID=223376 RepID=A0ABR3XBR6_9PEZI
MAVDVENCYRPTERLIVSSPRRHFRTKVRPVHWQLRSLIGSDKRDVVYFPTGNNSLHVQRLNTATCETETIKVLSFEPRCLVAGNGWVCCGGETGEFAAIQVDEDEDAEDLDVRPELNPDMRTSGEAGNSYLDSSILSIFAPPRSSKSLLVKSKKFGKERVNCITLWFPPTLANPVRGSYAGPVAVLANNDKSVALVSLRNQESLDELCYPDCVNRAVISPDGRLLVAISDDPYLYIHERREKDLPKDGSFVSADTIAYEWRPCGKVHLKSQSKNDRSDNRGSFAACFSSTGGFLAVGTQYGTISIFDASLLTDPDEDPLVTYFSSSRPNTETGAIRDMAFAPGGIDLLAWTEDRGRVGVADLRSGFVSRQILYLDKDDAYDHRAIIDRSSIDPRLLDPRADRSDPLASTLSSTLDLSSERRRANRSDGLPDLDSNRPPTHDETVVILEELRERNQRRLDQLTQSGAAGATSTTGTSSATSRLPWLERPNRSTLRPEGSRPRERSASVSRAISEIMGSIRDQRERLRENRDRLRESQERTRGAAREEIETERRRLPGIPLPRRTNGLGGSVGTAADSESQSAGRTLSRLMANNPFVLGSLVDPDFFENGSWEAYEGLRQTNEAEARRRDRASFLMREWEENNPNRRTAFAMRDTRTYDPHDTAGLAWSDDGQVLYVGAEDGIYEFHVNMLDRKLHPSIVLR